MTTILVVDDSAVDRRVIGDLLDRQSGWQIECVDGGPRALARIEDALPDVVVTDLQMPEMDGLQLVQAIHRRHPEVPVVLVTAHGSETLAVEALAQGAASYVPKSQMAEKLPDVVSEVLALAEAERHAEELLGWLSGASFELDNNPALIEPLVDMVQQMLVGMQFGDFGQRLRIGVALKEALLNALYHGNLEITFDQMQQAREKLVLGETFDLVQRRRGESPYQDRKIHIDAKVSAEEARFVIRDDGPGFDVTAVPEVGDPAALEPQRGRGLSLMRNFMDEVTYNQAGNQVTLVKRSTEGQADTAGRTG